MEPFNSTLSKYQVETKNRVAHAISVILNELNGGNREFIGNAILQRVQIEHRTLQQSFWAAMLTAQCGYADAEHDLRNEAAVGLAREIKTLTYGKGIRFLPYL